VRALGGLRGGLGFGVDVPLLVRVGSEVPGRSTERLAACTPRSTGVIRSVGDRGLDGIAIVAGRES
jgi:hypothetical protein